MVLRPSDVFLATQRSRRLRGRPVVPDARVSRPVRFEFLRPKFLAPTPFSGTFPMRRPCPFPERGRPTQPGWPQVSCWCLCTESRTRLAGTSDPGTGTRSSPFDTEAWTLSNRPSRYWPFGPVPRACGQERKDVLANGRNFF